MHSHELSRKLGVPHGIEPETEEIHLAHELEENDQTQPSIFEKELLNTPSAPLESFQEPACDDEIFVNGPLAASLDDAPIEKKATSVLDEIKYSSLNDGTIRAEPKVWCILIVGVYRL